VDSTQMSLADFANIPGADIVERGKQIYEFVEDSKMRHQYQYKRVSIDPSGPVRRVVDPYSGEIREMVYLASNDYLNLTTHPRVVQAGVDALNKYGAGAGSVPMLGGTFDITLELEQKVAAFKGTESAIIYTSGFGSNAGTLLSLLQKDDVAVLDRLVHASIVDGCMNTNIRTFKHNDMDSLDALLKRIKNKYRTKLIVVDGVYSMDGDIARLDEIVELAKIHGAYVMVDEAHATGVIGKTGKGTPEHFGLEGKVDIVAGTFSKALGVVGGFIASNKYITSLLTHYSRSFFFSTAMPPQVIAPLIAALEVIEQEPVHKENLWKNIDYFRSNLLSLGFNIGNSQTAIFPVIVGNDLKVKESARRLHEMGIYVNPVPFPAVAKKSERIRMSLMSTHTKEHLDKALNALEDVGREFKIIGSKKEI